MSWHNRIPLLSLSVLLALVSLAPAQEAGDKPAPRKDNPLDPLNVADPFVGRFEDDTIAVTVRRSQAGYVGEVEKGGQAFTFTATRKGDSLRGSFEFEGQQFDFVLTISGDSVTFATPRQLTRKKAGVAAAPAPATSTPPPAPVATPNPRPAQPNPGAAPVPPIKTGDKAVAAAAAAWKFKALDKDAASQAGRAWAGFPEGTFAIMETISAPVDQIPKEDRLLMLFKGAVGGKEIIHRFQFDGSAFGATGKPVEWLSSAQTLETLGFAAGKTSKQEFQVQGAVMKCDVTEYTQRTAANDKNPPVVFQVWTSAQVSLPPHTVALPQGNLLVGGDVVRITLSPGPSRTDRFDLWLEAMKQPVLVGGREFSAALIKTHQIAGNQQINTERYQTAQVPGGTARYVIERRQGGAVVETGTVSVIEIGVANVDAIDGLKR